MLKKPIILVFAVMMSASVAKCQSRNAQLSWPKITRYAKPWTRWWWLGNAVNKTGLKYNLQEFQKAGLGGVELSLIYGTKGYEKQFIKFLSPKWMKMYSYTVSEAHHLNMGVDLTGGTGWPYGGPNISIKNSACRAIFQKYTLHSGEALNKPVVVKNKHEKGIAPLQVLMAYSENGQKINLTSKVQSDGHLNWKAPSGTWTLIAVFNGKTLQQVKRAAPGGKGLVMDPFSATALHTYLRRFTKAFKTSGSPAPHAFFCDSYEVFGADWSPDFFKEFYKLRGYHLQDYLPQLLGMGTKVMVGRVRQDYRETLSNLLLNNFVTPWNKWSHSMGSLTRYQAHGSPGNLLNLYAGANTPETETTGHHEIHIAGNISLMNNPLFMKFASSAAHIAGRRYASSETFTWMAEHFRTSLSMAKPILDYLYISGINHVFYQGTPYSPKGAPWPGWQFYAAVDFSPYNTFWRDIPAFDKYIARSQSFLQAGQPDNDFLMYWPVQDIWYSLKKPLAYMYATGDINKWLQPTPFYMDSKKMIQDGYSLDYISDKYIQKAKVENGLLKTPGAAYKALVIPPTQFMPLKTFKDIIKLIREGGKVIFVGHLPEDVPGLHNWEARSKALQQLIESLPVAQTFDSVRQTTMGRGTMITGNNLEQELKLSGVPAEQMVKDGLQFERRKLHNGYAYFILDGLKNRDVNAWIPIAVPAESVAIFNPYNGKKGVARIKKSANGKVEVYVQIKPDQTLVLRTYTNSKVSGQTWKYYTPNDSEYPLNLVGPWNFTFMKGWPQIAGRFQMKKLASWTTLNKSAKSFSGTGKYVINFNLPNEKASNWLLSLGDVDASARVWVNGHYTGILWGVPFQERIGKYLKKGKNKLMIEVTNTAANRISAYDRLGKKWKIFYNLNVVNIHYRPFDAANWKPAPSGLIGPVTLIPLNRVSFR